MLNWNSGIYLSINLQVTGIEFKTITLDHFPGEETVQREDIKGQGCSRFRGPVGNGVVKKDTQMSSKWEKS
jgi:hypothetical protein